MSDRSPLLYLDDLLEAGKAIQGYVAGMTFAEFNADRLRQSAVIREFEIIGEAVGKLSDDLKAQAPSVAWQDIKDFRNLLVHQYFGVDLAIVWEVIQGDLPVLIDQTELLRQKVQS
jgi:uncharacterized protein with HEPN domain